MYGYARQTRILLMTLQWQLSLLSIIRRSLRFWCSGLSTVKDKIDMFTEDDEADIRIF